MEASSTLIYQIGASATSDSIPEYIAEPLSFVAALTLYQAFAVPLVQVTGIAAWDVFPEVARTLICMPTVGRLRRHTEYNQSKQQ
jgi:hypothetical protein